MLKYQFCKVRSVLKKQELKWVNNIIEGNILCTIFTARQQSFKKVMFSGVSVHGGQDPLCKGPQRHSRTCSNLLTMKRGLSASRRLAFDRNAFLCKYKTRTLSNVAEMTKLKQHCSYCWRRVLFLSWIEWSPGSPSPSLRSDSRSKDTLKPSSVSPATGTTHYSGNTFGILYNCNWLHFLHSHLTCKM